MGIWPEIHGKRLFAPPSVSTSENANGTIFLESGIALPDHERCVGEWLLRWAEERPETTFLAERDDSSGWRRVSYADALNRVLGLAGWLLSTGASSDHPILILSENTVDHALLALAAMHVGAPVATVSTAYSLMSEDHAKLKAMVELLDPSVIHVSDPDRYAGALAAIEGLHDAVILAGREPARAMRNVQLFAEADQPEASSAVSSAFHSIGPDTVARLLFTSGSTGTPKAVINTHRMLTSNQAAHAAVWTFLEAGAPVIVDWLPWSHTFGANFTFNMILRNGGSLYIDAGKPAPGLIDQTVANFKDVRPTMSFNVPRGYDLLADALERDADFRDVFFAMDLAMNAAAALPSSVWEKLKAISRETIGREMPIVGAWGSTETAPLATHCHFEVDNIANIGLPVPGVTLKLVPNGNKQEVRVKGPNVTPGYYRHPELTAQAFDEGGFYKIGDALKFVDPNDVSKGFIFDGRVTEDFKLSTGTWVAVGAVRAKLVDDLSGLVRDAVIVGENESQLGALLWLSDVARQMPPDELKATLSERLTAAAKAATGSASRVRRARILAQEPTLDRGEVTEKGSLNQRALRAGNAGEIDRLYRSDEGVIIA